MLNKLKKVGIAAAFLTLPATVQAATISGQIDIVGLVNLGSSEFSATGNADLSDTGSAIQVTGDFDGPVSVGDSVTLFDIDFSGPTPAQIWNVGGFSFSAISFESFQNASIFAFDALGLITGNGFDATLASLSFTSQAGTGTANVSFSTTTASSDTTPAPVPLPAAGPLLLLGLGGLAVARKKKRKAA